MNKNIIGIFLARKPQLGGAHQYTLSMIRALESLSQKHFNTIVYYQEREWESFIPASFQKSFQKRPLINRVFSWFYKNIDKSQNGYRRFPVLCNPIIGIINKSECELIIFPDQDLECYQIKKKSLVTVHDLMHRYEPYFAEYSINFIDERDKHYFNICKHVTGVLVDSEIGKKQIIESYNRKDDTVYVLKFVPPYYLLDYKVVDVKSKYALPEEYFFYPAQYWQHKNHENLIRAVKILKDNGILINLVLVGARKNYFTAITKLIERLEIRKQVMVLGYVPNEDMGSLYKRATALVFVSFLGPTNIPPLEAMLMGCPVICSNKYAMPEQIGDAGLLVDPSNPQDIADKMYQLKIDKSLRESLINRGYQKIKEYDQECFNIRLHEIITDILHK
jgi:glycosyltransferase involved in cell wall biosynthesis